MYRFFEILPGTLAWLTLFLIVLFSWRLPVFASVFIILFDIYWLLKTIYLSLHLRSTFSAMKENLKIDWLGELARSEWHIANSNDKNLSSVSHEPFAISWRDIYHLVVLPMYREPYEVVRESFESLVRANYPKDKFIVVLAIEERALRQSSGQAGSGAEETAEKIKQEFASQFFKFLITTHPANLPGEIPGKGSNETWAVREAKRLIIDPLVNARTCADDTQTNAEVFPRSSALSPRESALRYENILAEVFPRSSALSPRESALRYENILVSVFDIDTQIFLEYFGRLTYVFLRASNRLRAIYQPVPLFTNNIYRAPALARVIAFSSTFWQMMQQARPERLTSFSSQSLPLPVLLDIGFWHTDVVSEDSRIFWQGYLRYHGDFRVEPLLYPVSMDANVATGFWQTMRNNYRQHRRWAWGAENISYMLCGAGRAPSNEGFLYDSQIPRWKKWYWSFSVIEGFHSWATNSLMIFALGWLPVLIGGGHFNVSLLSYSLPQITKFIIQLSMLGVAGSAIASILILPPRPTWFRWYHYFLYFLQWIFIPVTLIVFGAFPAIEAQTRLALGGKWRLGFWPTPKHRLVSSK